MCDAPQQHLHTVSMLKECAICCEDVEFGDLHIVCPVCIAEDKLTCSTCWTKLIEIHGVDFREDRVQLTVTCPWCRSVVPQHELMQTTFARSNNYLKSIHPKLILVIQLLSMDRADLRTVVEQQGVSTNAYLTWRLQRELRPTSVDVQEHVEHHNRAHGAAMAIAAAFGQPDRVALPEGVSAWQVDTGQIPAVQPPNT
jgi:hypothetical protein